MMKSLQARVIEIDGFQSGEESLDFTDTADIIGDFEDGTLTLTGDASLADYQAALRSVTYEITSIAHIVGRSHFGCDG